MSIVINLSPTLTDQLQIQAALLGVTLNELAEKLIHQGLSKQIWRETVLSSESTIERNVSKNGSNNNSQNLASTNVTEHQTDISCRDFLLSVAGTSSSGTSDTSINVKSIVNDMLSIKKVQSRILNVNTL